jgi:hypothetical protein
MSAHEIVARCHPRCSAIRVLRRGDLGTVPTAVKLAEHLSHFLKCVVDANQITTLSFRPRIHLLCLRKYLSAARCCSFDSRVPRHRHSMPSQRNCQTWTWGITGGLLLQDVRDALEHVAPVLSTNETLVTLTGYLRGFAVVVRADMLAHAGGAHKRGTARF